MVDPPSGGRSPPGGPLLGPDEATEAIRWLTRTLGFPDPARASPSEGGVVDDDGGGAASQASLILSKTLSPLPPLVAEPSLQGGSPPYSAARKGPEALSDDPPTGSTRGNRRMQQQQLQGAVDSGDPPWGAAWSDPHISREPRDIATSPQGVNEAPAIVPGLDPPHDREAAVSPSGVHTSEARTSEVHTSEAHTSEIHTLRVHPSGDHTLLSDGNGMTQLRASSMAMASATSASQAAGEENRGGPVDREGMASTRDGPNAPMEGPQAVEVAAVEAQADDAPRPPQVRVCTTPPP